MYSSIRRFLLPVLSCLTAVLLVFAAITFATEPISVYADDTAAKITVSSANNGRYPLDDVKSQFNDAGYKNLFLIPNSLIKSKTSNGGAAGNFPLNNAFDNNEDTYWFSERANTADFKNHVIVNFTKTVNFKDLMYKASFYSRDDGRHFDGYPTKLNIYTANGNDNFSLAGTYEGEPKSDFSEMIVFSLPTGVKCDRIKIEFAEICNYSAVSPSPIATARDFAFYESNEGVYVAKKGDGNHANASYLSYNAVSADEMKIRANGGGVINNAFDKNAGTYWTSESYNTDEFTNKVTLTMNIPQTISNIVYACSYYTVDGVRNFSGYPTKLTVTATGADDSKTVYTFLGTPGSDWRFGDFAFPESVTCKKLELEFTELTTFSNIANGNPVVSTGEIYLVKSTSATAEEMIARINEIFTDYAQYEIKEGVTVETVAAMREEAKLISNYEQSLKPTLDRAEAILTGAMRKDPYREFSTDPNAKNTIEQYGALADYCRNTLYMSSFGTDRQVIGIGGTTGETITIYVEADEGDPLPSVAFTQITGAWQSWIRTYTLQRGKNEIVFPNFKTSSYSVPVAAGGPIHIVNPYTPDKQSSNVKLYFEGGYVYPVFHDGDDESTFKIILKDYYERLKDPNDSSITIDAFEAVTDNAILSCSATLAYNSYIKNGTSPQYNVDKWRKYTKTTLAYGGVVFDPSKPYYDAKNNYIKVNYRTVQPYAGFYAFAASEHVGLPSSDLHGAMVQYWTLGWAFYHEMGHQLDNRRMMIGEVTNNMWSIYNLYMVEGNIADRINVTAVSKNLASDFSNKVGNYWYNGNSNCDFWWILEGVCPGYWGRLQQLYCFEYQTTEIDKAITNSVERLCYYSSLAIGEDASSYFERFGFYFNLSPSAKFTKAGASQAFKNAMDAAKKAGRIKDTDKKYWYVNNGQYRAIRAHDETLDESWGSCYDASQTVAPLKIMGTNGSYTLLLPTPQKPDAHLCYEIQGYIGNEWKVLGVTDGTSFSDTRNYGDAIPQYRVYAYDRFFNHTGDPQAVSPQTSNTQTNVCKIGDVYYNTLKEAVAVANADTSNQKVIIYLLKDFEDGGITFSRPNKNITILPDPTIFTGNNGVTITKSSAGDLFDMVWGDVVLGSAENNVPTSAPIILDGGSFSQSGTLIRTHGKNIVLNNVTLQNNYNSGDGGGLSADYGTTMSLNGCTIKNNRAANGGGFAAASYAEVNIRGLTITDNTATGKGGGIYVSSGEYSVVCRDISGNYSKVLISGNSAANGGGIYVERTIELNNAQIINNTATQNGGGVYTAVNNDNKYLKLSNSTVEGNSASVGDAIYMHCGRTLLEGTKVRSKIYKNRGANPASRLELSKTLSDFSGCEFVISGIVPKEGLVLFDAITDLSDESLSGFVTGCSVYNGRLAFESGKGVVVYPLLAKVTINGGDESFTTEMSIGDFTLPDTFEGLPEDKYIESYTIDGNSYAVGQKIAVTGDFVATAVVKSYCKVTLIYGTYSEEYTLKQGVAYYLPMKTKDNEVVFGWDCSDGNYYAYAEGVVIERDTVFNAVIKRLHTVVTVVEGIETSAQYEYNGTVTLTSPPNVFGKVFSHWEIDGKKYQPNQTLKVTRDFVATAVYADTWTVTTVIEDEESTQTCANGTQIELKNADASLGREFKYWLINNVKYYAGSTYTVNSDSEIVAVFAQIDTAATIRVTFILNKGSVEGSDEIVEDQTTYQNYAFNAKHTFTAPAVNAGNVFKYWEVNGVKYYAGDQITVTEEFTAIAAVTQETGAEQNTDVTVKVKDYVGNSLTETQYTYAVNSNVYLAQPSAEPSGKAFSHFEVKTADGDTTRYEAGETIVVTSAMQIVAVYDTAYTVTVTQIVDGKKVSETYKYGNTRLYTLPAPKSVDDDKIFSHWEVDGAVKNVGDSFAVTKDTQITAVYNDVEKVTVTLSRFVNGKFAEESSSVKVGSSYPLGTPDATPDGKVFLHWDVNGVQYSSGSTVIVLKDTQITAVYNDISSEVPGGEDGPNAPDHSGGEEEPNDPNMPADSGDGPNVGLIVGIVVPVVVVLGGGAAAVIIILKKKKSFKGDK